MIKYSRFIILITEVALMAWALPWAWQFAFSRPANYPFTMYSCIARNFVSIDRASGENIYRDVNGTVYTNHQFDSILPTFYYRQLMSDGRLPLEIEGRPVNARSIQQGNFMFRHATTHINTVQAPLYFLLEAMSGRVDLEMPGDVFRMTDRMEFVDMATNTVNEEKSRLFTEVLKTKGFVFPVNYVAGNPTVRKEYDEGYLMLDARHQVFHVKQLCGRPFVRNTGIAADLKMKYAFVTEFRNRRFYGILTDAENQAYILEAKTYELQKLPLPSFNPETENMTIFGDDFYWTIQVSGDQYVKLYAVKSDDYSLVDTMVWTAGTDRVAEYIFPFELSFTDYGDKFVYPRITAVSLWALLLNTVLALGYMVCKRRNLKSGLLGTILLFFFGIYALLPVCLLVKAKNSST